MTRKIFRSFDFGGGAMLGKFEMKNLIDEFTTELNSYVFKEYFSKWFSDSDN